MPEKATASEDVVAATNNDFLDTLIIGHKWNDDHPVTFYFDDGDGVPEVWLDAANDALRNTFSTYENYIDLEFEEVDNADDANFVLKMRTLNQIGATARFGYPDESDDEAVGQFPHNWSRWTPWHLQEGGYAYETVLHEVGHGLGLGHPHGMEGLNGQPFAGVNAQGDAGDDGQNSGIYTVMSYNDWGEFWAPDNPVSSNYGWGYIATPMALDVAALQHIYGANTNYNSGHTVYTLPDTNPVGNGGGTFWSLIWDTDGNDKILHSGSVAATIDLRAAPLTGPNAGGYLSQVDGIFGGFTIANGVTIEYAEGGSGADTLIGNGAGNEIAGRVGNDDIYGRGGGDLLLGGKGNDYLNGGGGVDSMYGGSGDDTYVVNTGSDEVHEGAGRGTDEVLSSVSYTLGTNVEYLSLTPSSINGIDGTGNSLDNKITGNNDGNTLKGRAGDDFINGGAGNDDINGGSGKDTLWGGSGSDVLDGGGGNQVLAIGNQNGLSQEAAAVRSVRTAETRLEDEFLAALQAAPVTGSDDELHGGNDNDQLMGRGGNDSLFGDFGNDILLGGAGADWLDGGFQNDYMKGGSGNDIYVVDSNSDSVVENANGGVDGVFSSVSYTLGAHVENLALLGGPGNHINGTGNGLANWIIGNAGNNVLSGRGGGDFVVGLDGDDILDGGTGADVLFGGAGNDILDGGDDAIIMLAGLGAAGLGTQTATALAAANTVADPIARIEAFQLNDDLMALLAPANALQFGFADLLNGGSGDDILLGQGGNDTLNGEDGDDILGGGSGSDLLDGGMGNDGMFGGAGGDTMLGGQQDDALSGGSGADSMLGQGGADALSGDTGDDTLKGGGGQDALSGGDGNDKLRGGGGADDLNGGDDDDNLRGNGGNDTLNGGNGNDTLRGDAGDDVFGFSTAIGPGNVDKIVDFMVGDDQVELNMLVFTGLSGPGALAASEFEIGNAATAAATRILYDDNAGMLLYDADGVGGAAANLFATISPNLALSETDIFGL